MRTPLAPPRRRLRTVMVGCWVTALGLLGALLTTAPPTQADPTDTYTNPVSGEVRNFADPTVIRGHDGWWYSYATNGVRWQGDSRQLLKIMKSRDLVTWEWVGPVFLPGQMPTWDGGPAGINRQLWAPEISMVNGKYVLYYSFVVPAGEGHPYYSAIGAAVADHPAGPWTDVGHPVTAPETWTPRPGATSDSNIIDPEVITDSDGQRWLYYGSVLGGVKVVRLSDDGLHAQGEATQLTVSHRYEASYVIHRDGFYYLMLSEIGGCCAGPASAYPVVVGRSTEPTGPFVDRDGHPLSGIHGGGTPVVWPNGNPFISTGHNSVATDPSGQDWILTHAIDRNNPLLNGTSGGSARALAVTRLDWIDGWPVARAGQGIPTEATAPDMTTVVADTFENADLAYWQANPRWQHATEPAGGFVRTTGDSPLVSTTAARGDLRMRGAVRLADGDGGRAGLSLVSHGRNQLTAWLDRDRHALVVEARQGQRTQRRVAPLPANHDFTSWHEIAITRRGDTVRAEVTESGQYDPTAIVTLQTVAGLHTGPVALRAEGTAADVDDVTVARLYTPVTERVPDPGVGSQVWADEFEDGLGAGWQWTHGDPGVEVRDGALHHPIQRSGLIDRRPNPNQASALVRTMPEGTWTLQTRVTVPFGASFPHGWPQAGIIARASDDEWTSLSYSSRNDTRLVAFGKETVFGERTHAAWAALGPTRDTMWLRLHHTVADNGEHLYRAATSIDGEQWVWHGVRVLPAGPQPQVGLIAMGLDPRDDQPDLTARFDHVRLYR